MLHWPSAECFWLLEILFHPSVPSAGGTAGRQCCLGWWSGILWCWPHQKKPCPGSRLKNPKSKENSKLTVKKKRSLTTQKGFNLSTEILFVWLVCFECCTKLHHLFFLLLCWVVACSHQVGEDVVVSSAVLSWGHHLQVRAEDTMSHIHNSQSAKTTKRQQKAAESKYLGKAQHLHRPQGACEHISVFVWETHTSSWEKLQWQALFLFINFKI